MVDTLKQELFVLLLHWKLEQDVGDSGWLDVRAPLLPLQSILLAQDELDFLIGVGSIELVNIDQSLAGLQVPTEHIKQLVVGKVNHIKCRDKGQKPCPKTEEQNLSGKRSFILS